MEDHSETQKDVTMTFEVDLTTIHGRCAQLALDKGIKPVNVRAYLRDVSGLSIQAIHGWFKGTTKAPAAEPLAKIAKHFKTDLMWIVTGEPDPRFLEHAYDAPDLDTLMKQKIQEYIGGGILKSLRLNMVGLEITTTFHEEDAAEKE